MAPCMLRKALCGARRFEPLHFALASSRLPSSDAHNGARDRSYIGRTVACRANMRPIAVLIVATSKCPKREEGRCRRRSCAVLVLMSTPSPGGLAPMAARTPPTIFREAPSPEVGSPRPLDRVGPAHVDLCRDFFTRAVALELSFFEAAYTT